MQFKTVSLSQTNTTVKIESWVIHMGKYYNKFVGKNIDLAPLGIERREDNSPYFCTPKGASIIGWAGVDGIHYCFVRGFGEMVFAVNPMEIAPNYVRPLAGSFEDFLRLLLACKDANILEQARRWKSEEFYEMLGGSISAQSAYETLDRIAETMHLTPMEKPWEYMKELQDSFDYSKIKYTEDFYDPELNENAPAEEWAVYFDGTIYGHSGRDKAGVEISVEKEFQFADHTWLVPAVYSCAKGLVVDFCMQVDAEDFQCFWNKWSDRYSERLNHRERLLAELENPLLFEFEPQVTVNGKVLKRRNSSGICYIPSDPSEPETRFIVEHYHLDSSFAWSFSRVCFPWATGRRPEIKSLELTMTQEPVRVPGEVFEVSGLGDQIDLKIPENSFTLTVKDYEPQVLDASMLSPDNMEYPTCYTMMIYTLSPKPEEGQLYIQDLSECDQPRPKETEHTAFGSCEAAAISIIGGADGPTAMIVGAPQTEHEFAACSAPHFEPAKGIQWYPILHVTKYEPDTITLI